jgi:hypothetical protein
MLWNLRVVWPWRRWYSGGMGANAIDATYEEKIGQLQRTIDRRNEELKILQEGINKKNQKIKELEADLRYANLGIKAIKAILEDS